MIMDHYYDKWRKWKDLSTPPGPFSIPPYPPSTNPIPPYPQSSPISKEEIEEFRKLLDRAREYDKKYNQPDCELEEKKKLLKDLADKMGIDVSFL